MAWIDAGAVWIKPTRNGGKMLSGKVEINGKSYAINLFKNSYKEEGSQQPDYKISRPDDDNGTPVKEFKKKGDGQSQNNQQQNNQGPPEDDDTIPF